VAVRARCQQAAALETASAAWGEVESLDEQPSGSDRETGGGKIASRETAQTDEAIVLGAGHRNTRTAKAEFA
jgi:hypothetical protein